MSLRTIQQIKAGRSKSASSLKPILNVENYFLLHVDPLLAPCITFHLCSQLEREQVLESMLTFFQNRRDKKSLVMPITCKKISKSDQHQYLVSTIGPIMNKLIGRVALKRPLDVLGFFIHELRNIIEYERNFISEPYFPVIELVLASNKIHIAVLGNQSSGKTTFLNTLQGIHDGNPRSTLGFKSIPMALSNGTNVVFYDLGGSSKIRNIWEQYFHDIHGLIFVVDSSSSEETMNDTISLFETTLSNPLLGNKPVLLLANKQDNPSSRRPEEVQAILLNRSDSSFPRDRIVLRGCRTSMTGKIHATDGPSPQLGYRPIPFSGLPNSFQLKEIVSGRFMGINNGGSLGDRVTNGISVLEGEEEITISTEEIASSSNEDNLKYRLRFKHQYLCHRDEYVWLDEPLPPLGEPSSHSEWQLFLKEDSEDQVIIGQPQLSISSPKSFLYVDGKFQKMGTEPSQYILLPRRKVDLRVEEGLMDLINMIQRNYSQLNSKVVEDTILKQKDIALKREEKELRVLKNKIASVFSHLIPSKLLPEDFTPADPEDIFSKEEGLQFLATEIDQEVSSLDPLALEISSLVGYHKFSLQIIGGYYKPVSKKKSPKPWLELRDLVLELRAQLSL